MKSTGLHSNITNTYFRIKVAMESSEYKTLTDCAGDLQLALKDNLSRLSMVLFAKYLITLEQSSELLNLYHNEVVRASKLIHWILGKVQQNVDYYYIFIDALNDESPNYDDLLRKLQDVLIHYQQGSLYSHCFTLELICMITLSDFSVHVTVYLHCRRQHIYNTKNYPNNKSYSMAIVCIIIII